MSASGAPAYSDPWAAALGRAQEANRIGSSAEQVAAADSAAERLVAEAEAAAPPVAASAGAGSAAPAEAVVDLANVDPSRWAELGASVTARTLGCARRAAAGVGDAAFDATTWVVDNPVSAVGAASVVAGGPSMISVAFTAAGMASRAFTASVGPIVNRMVDGSALVAATAEVPDIATAVGLAMGGYLAYRAFNYARANAGAAAVRTYNTFKDWWNGAGKNEFKYLNLTDEDVSSLSVFGPLMAKLVSKVLASASVADIEGKCDTPSDRSTKSSLIANIIEPHVEEVNAELDKIDAGILPVAQKAELKERMRAQAIVIAYVIVALRCHNVENRSCPVTAAPPPSLAPSAAASQALPVDEDEEEDEEEEQRDPKRRRIGGKQEEDLEGGHRCPKCGSDMVDRALGVEKPKRKTRKAAAPKKQKKNKKSKTSKKGGSYRKNRKMSEKRRH